MKLIHTADLHIDSPLTARLSPDKSRERRAEILSTLSRLIAEARRLGAAAIIIAGDLFDSNKITARAREHVYQTMKEAEDIEFFYLRGNHDAATDAEARMYTLPNVHLFTDHRWRKFECADGVTVSGIDSGEEGTFDALELDKNDKNIVVLHGELRDGRSGGNIINPKEAAGKNIDYMALGHYHSYSETKIDERGIAVYSGTPEGRGFDEAGECGFVLLDTDGDGIRHEFISFAKRRLHILPLDITDIQSGTEIKRAAHQLLSTVPKKDLVRLVLVGGYTPGLWKDTEGLCEEFSDSFYYFEVKDSSRISIKPDDYKNDKSLKGEFIRTVYSDTSLDDDTKARIIACGLGALMGEAYEG